MLLARKDSQKLRVIGRVVDGFNSDVQSVTFNQATSTGSIAVSSSGVLNYTDSIVAAGAIPAIGPLEANESVWTI